MLNTFENAGRQHLRRVERERHIRKMDAFAKGLDFMDDPDAPDACSMVDALSGNPLQKIPEDSFLGLDKNGKYKRVRSMIVLTVLVGLILIGFLFGFGVGERDSSRQSKSKIGDTTARHKSITTLILGWGITPRERLDDLSSPPARALDWLAYNDLETTQVEAIRTRFVLATLFFATQSPNIGHTWKEDRHWLSSYPVCLWHGVECFDAGQTMDLVKSLNLSSNELTGTIPEEIGLLGPDIRSLDLSDNELAGTIPETAFLMKNLGTLDIVPRHSWTYFFSHLV